MNIVFVGPFGLQPKGTMSVRAVPLAQAIAAQGHTVTVLIPPWDDPTRAGQTWRAEGVTIRNLSLPVGVPGLFHLGLVAGLVAAVRQLQPDIVHCFKPKAYAGLTHWALHHLRRAGLFRGKLVVDSDDWEQAWNEVGDYSWSQKQVFTWQEQWGLRQADGVTVASRALHRLVSEQRGESASICYLPNGQRPVSHTATPSEIAAVRTQWQLDRAPTILLYSRFLEFRLSRIVTLVQSVAAQSPTTRWLIVGQGLQGEEEQLQALLRAQELSHFVRFTGWVPAQHLPAYFQAADLAIHPYDDTVINRTKCSVKLIDLLSAGLAVVADRVGQNGAYIEGGESGLLVPAEDDVAFGSAIVRLLNDNPLRQQIGQTAAQRMSATFRWARLAEAVLQFYGCVPSRISR